MDSVSNLPFCINDVTAMGDALHNGLKVDKKDIISCGDIGHVKVDDFLLALSEITSSTEENDTVIFYFSGHGLTEENKHYLVFSDGIINTQEIIKYFEKIPAKSKIIFLDCCKSGNYTVSGTSKFNIEKTVAEFQGKGYAVFSSSKSDQLSYGHPDKPISVFTSFLCDALQDKLIVRKGKVSLHDIQKLVSLYLDIWNKKNPNIQQHPIFRAEMGGTIFFEVQDYEPFHTSNIYVEHEKYIIYKVEPVHTAGQKRYSAKVILKEPLSLEEIGRVSLNIIERVKTVEIYGNEISQKRWIGKPANIIWIYYGRDESDMINSNFICRTTWVDDSQDKDWWYRVKNEDTFMLNGIHFNIHPYYEHLKVFQHENKANKDEIIFKTKEILSYLLTLAEKVIYFYNEFKNEMFSEMQLVNKIESLIPEIEKYYFLSTDMKLPPDDIRDFYQACSELFGTIFEFTLYYNKQHMSQRTAENRIACMDMAIKQYYSELDKVRTLEEQL